MKKYSNPNVEITNFDVNDIITVSGAIVNADTFTGKDAEMYDVYVANSEAKNTNVSVFTW